MPLSPHQFVQLIHDSPGRVVLATSGGGSRAIAELLEVPGASRTLLEAAVPYSAPAMAEWLGGRPEEFCSAATARAMAMAAFRRALRYCAPEEGPAGVACSAALATDRPKRGEHRVHVALQTAERTVAWSLQLLKGRRSRLEEERVAGYLVLNAVAEACELANRPKPALLEGERVEESRAAAPAEWRDLLLGKAPRVRLGPDGDPPKVVFPGSFNPLHSGHRRMKQFAEEMLQRPAALEISILNADKPPLDYIEIQRRLGQFPSEWAVHLTRAPRFEEKSELFAGATFIVGADTLRRIAAPRYYGGRAGRRKALKRIAENGCRFLVFSRRGEGGELIRLADLDLPDVLRAICQEVPPETFSEDVSSTALRQWGSE